MRAEAPLYPSLPDAELHFRASALSSLGRLSECAIDALHAFSR